MANQFDNVKLEKGMYREAGHSFTEILEKQDPSEAYKGTDMEGMDAFQRQLKRFDIKARGMGSDVVEKFFATSQSAVLFPEYVARTVKQGMEEANLLPSITATTTYVDGMDYRSILSVPEKEDKKLTKLQRERKIETLTEEMRQAAKALEFERAAYLRDLIKELRNGK